MIKNFTAISASVIAVASSEAALAYVGPGAGLSLLGALWGLLIAIIAALGFMLAWPIRRMRRRRSDPIRTSDDGTESEEDGHKAS